MAAIEASLPARFSEPQLIARGGMADVVRARDESLGRVVAIKVLAERFARDEEVRARFLREGRTAASLSDERFVVAIYDVGETRDGLPYIVMEYAPGGTVAERIGQGPVEVGQSMRWLDQAASALDAAHEQGIVHRDVKPANLLLAADDTVRVSDFGIARATGYATLTLAGTVLGSAGYMAPEQARGQPSTAATDRYALACVAFELLTGSRPFARDNMTAEAAAHVNEAPPLTRVFDPALPPTLDRIFAHGLAKNPAARPVSCKAFVNELRRSVAFGVAVEPTTVDQPSPVVVRRSGVRRGLVAVGAVALAAAGGGLAWALAQGGDDSTSTVVLTATLPGETVVRTVTSEGETVQRTVTSEGATVVVTQTAEETTPDEPPATTTPPAATTPAAPPPTGESGRSLNDRGFQLLRRGDVASALPLLESAVASLQGDSTITEAYASYNLAWARFASGRCDGVAELLERSQSIQGYRREIERLRVQVESRCDDD